MLGPFATTSRLTPIHQMSLAVLSRAACASMSTTTTTTTTRDRGDRYGPMEWAQWMWNESWYYVARIVLRAPRRSDASPLLSTLHWQPVQQRIDYKLALPTFKVRSTSTPSYLHRLLQETEDVHHLWRQSATSTLCRPFTKMTVTALAVWNLLPKTVTLLPLLHLGY